MEMLLLLILSGFIGFLRAEEVEPESLVPNPVELPDQAVPEVQPPAEPTQDVPADEFPNQEDEAHVAKRSAVSGAVVKPQIINNVDKTCAVRSAEMQRTIQSLSSTVQSLQGSRQFNFYKIPFILQNIF